MPEKEILFVLARSEAQYYQWFRYGRKTDQASRFVESHETLAGMRLPALRFVALPGWHKHRYANAIERDLKNMGVDPDQIKVEKGFRWDNEP